MNLEDQVVSLELAKRLKELGVEQESLFHFVVKHSAHQVPYYTLLYLGGRRKGVDFARAKISGVSAFTVAELGEMLPPHTPTAKRAGDDGWICNGHFPPHPAQAHQTIADTEADARAKMLVYLLEHKLLEV